jgi:hypothetical protein
MNDMNNSFEKSKKKNFGEYYSFFIVFLRYFFLLPILLIFSITLHTHLTKDINWDFINNTALFPLLIWTLVLCFSYLTIFYFHNLYYKQQITKKNLSCALCEKEAIVELYKIPNFFITFGIPLCEQHAKSLDENPEIFLYREQNLYKKYNRIIFWFTILTILFGFINLIYFGNVYGFNKNIPLTILIYLLFTIETFFYFFLYIRMFLSIITGIRKFPQSYNTTIT